jgi:hypothetical protein
MILQNIEVFVDATPERRAADQLCSYARPPVRRRPCRNPRRIRGSPGVSIRLNVIGEKAMRTLLVEWKAAAEAATSNVRRRFTKRDLSAEFRVSRPDEDLTLGSPHSDLVVIGQDELQELKVYASPKMLLLSSGAPILVIPSGWKSESKVLVGWSASREARCAVADALPCRG